MAEPFQTEIEAFERQDRAAPPPPGAVVFLGSSTLRLWTTLEQDFPGIPVVNRGFGGSQIADSICYAPRIVFPLKPATLVFYAGENDLAAGKTPEQVAADFQRLVADVQTALPATRILFVSLKPSPCRAGLLDAMRQANALIKDLMQPDPRLEFVDVFTPMLDETGTPRAELFADDRLHLNAAGYALWTRILRPRLAPAAMP